MWRPANHTHGVCRCDVVRLHVPVPQVSLCSGAMAGIMVDVSMFPIDTVKTRMQVNPYTRSR